MIKSELKKRLGKKSFARWQQYAHDKVNSSGLGGWLYQFTMCEKCGCTIMLFGEYDAYACPQCNEWQSEGCGDPNCTYCFDRPQTPNEALAIYEAKRSS